MVNTGAAKGCPWVAGGCSCHIEAGAYFHFIKLFSSWELKCVHLSPVSIAASTHEHTCLSTWEPLWCNTSVYHSGVSPVWTTLVYHQCSVSTMYHCVPVCILHHFPLIFVLTFSSSVTLMMYPDDFVSRCDAIAKDSLSTSSVMNPIWQKSIAKKSLSTDYNQIASVLARSLPVWWWFSG